MDDTNNPDFIRQRERALERMREMSERAGYGSEPHKMPPAPPFVRLPDEQRGRSGDSHSGQPDNRYSGNPDSRYNGRNNDGRQNGQDAPPPKSPPASGQTAAPRDSFPGLGGLGSMLSNLRLPLPDLLKTDSDMTLILGLILILQSDKSDRWLLLALLYILI